MNGEENTTDLPSVQAWMQNALVNEGEYTPTEQIGELIVPSPTLNPAQRLAIYQRGYYARLLQCLEGQFKALRHALGPELFADFGREYLREFPSQSPTLGELGARFAHYLAKNRPDAGSEEKESWIDFMIDLALFEWELYILFNAPGHEGKPYADETVSDERLILQPAFSLHEYGFPVALYYREVAHGNDPPVPAPQASYIALVRKNFKTGIVRLSPVQFHFLVRVKNGTPILNALADTARTLSLPDGSLQKVWPDWKKEWAKWGMFVAR